jgi:ATP-dependent RNA helicase RhlE
MTFHDFDIAPECLNILRRQNIEEPTPVQAAAIPPALQGRDILAVAQTGTGKTLAFCLPALTRLAAEKPRRNRMLVLTPTRELAQQVHGALTPFCKTLRLRAVCIVGGVGMTPQTRDLKKGCDIIVATPGRLIDHLQRRNVDFKSLNTLVLDEADRMLDMGFLPDIRRIVNGLPGERQTLLFSATFPDSIRQLANDFQHDVKKIRIDPGATPAETVNQRMYTTAQTGKAGLLAEFLEQPEVVSALVFARTRHRTDRVAKQLKKQGVNAQSIHGGHSQNQRERALDKFRRRKCNVLVATDVAARGIDIEGISHVVNFDIPGSFEDYVHRIGRTGRANNSGEAVTFVSPQDIQELGAIEKGLGKTLKRIDWSGAVNVLSLFGNTKKSGKKSGGKRPGRNRRMRARAVR